MKETFKGRSLVGGAASGEVLVSKKAFTFAHGVDPASGRVTDFHSEMEKENVKGRILLYPHGKGSTTGSSWFLETVRLGNGPAAIVTQAADLTAVVGSVMAMILYGKAIPVLSGLPEELWTKATPGAHISVDGNAGKVVLG